MVQTTVLNIGICGAVTESKGQGGKLSIEFGPHGTCCKVFMTDNLAPDVLVVDSDLPTGTTFPVPLPPF